MTSIGNGRVVQQTFPMSDHERHLYNYVRWDAQHIDEIAEAAGLEKTVAVADPKQAAEVLVDIVTAGDLVLVKGSRSARTERVLEEFSNQQSALSHSA